MRASLNASESYRLARYTLLALLLIVSSITVATVVAEDASCPTGSYAFNLSGQFICVPAVSNYSTPLATINGYYVSDTSLNLTITCLEAGGCTVYVSLLNATNAAHIYSTTLSMQAGEQDIINIDTGGNYPVVVNASVNGVQLPLFLIQPQFKQLQPGITATLSGTPLLPIYTLLMIAPILGMMMRGNGREAGIGLIVESVLLPRLAMVMGLSEPLTYMVMGLAFTIGVLLVAIYR